MTGQTSCGPCANDLKYECLEVIRGHIDKFCLQVHNFGNNEDKQMILTPDERSFYVAPDDISFFNIITVPFDTEPPPRDDLLDAVSEEVSSLVSAPRKNSIFHIFVCLVMVALEVILDFWKKEEIARSKIWAINHNLTVPKDREKHHHPSRQRSPSHKFGNSHGFRSFRPPDITAPAL